MSSGARENAATSGATPHRDSAATEDFVANSAPDAELPACIGRYRVERLLGMGGFGVVYLAHDEQLHRPIAIKVPHAQRIRNRDDAAPYLREARMVANLDHPHIVPVYDVGSSQEFPCFIVSKFIDGQNLADRLRQSRYTWTEAAELVAKMADAVHYAHTRGLVHRDIKPGNILIDRMNNPFVVDFGLALRDDDAGTLQSFVGTTTYMSPEQARGEGHRVDGRSDIFSLGIVFYELLTGRKPFRGDTKDAVLDQIASAEPRPPRQIVDGVPKELERICLRALAKRATDRYTTAKDFADDLRNSLSTAPAAASWQAPGGRSAGSSAPREGSSPLDKSSQIAAIPSTSHVARIVPKGLRSFDEHDADFFLELLPGPRDRNGLPDSIRFWKSRIDQPTAEGSFKVGLIYGPSGCGKSSLVKAGLLPRLSPGVIAIHVEATPDETELRLLGSLRKRFPEIDAGLNLKQTFVALRRGQGLEHGRKALIVLDQFEQWLHARKDDSESELVQALRQCDGDHLQCLVLVRDDFYIAVNRFFQQLEIPVLEGHNYALVDLFDPDHAQMVLAAFGQAYGRLPESKSAFTPDQHAFLAQAVAGLAQDGRVISVRIALFADMMKGRAWTTAELRAVGGTEGVGVTFLEETFSAKTAPPTHRLHQAAARAMLKALLPEAETDIKGQMQPVEKLRQICGYAERPDEFQTLLTILESDVRLIAPTEPEGAASSLARARHYQLTHDFLVPSIRDWLSHKQAETPRGRAELRLAERNALWMRKPERKQLPSWGEWLSICLQTRRRDWSESQRRMMAAATRLQFQRMGLALAAVLLLIGGGFATRHFAVRRAQDVLVESLVSQLWQIDLRHLPGLLDQWEAQPERRRDEIAKVADDVSQSVDQRTRAHLALARDDPAGLAFLQARLLDADAVEHKVYSDELARWNSRIVPDLWRTARDDQLEPERLLRTAAALAGYDPGSEHWESVAARTVRPLLNLDPLRVNPWIDSLYPVRSHLLKPLSSVYHDPRATPRERLLAASILASFVGRDEQLLDVASLVDLLLDADAEAFGIIQPILQRRSDGALEIFRNELSTAAPLHSESGTAKLLARQANAVEALFQLGETEPFWNHLGDDSDPRLRTILIGRLSRVVADWRRAFERLPSERNPRIRQAIILGAFTSQRDLSPSDRSEQIESLLDLFRNDPDAGVHSAAEWLLRSLGADEQVASEAQRLARQGPADANWSVEANGLTFVHISKPGRVIIGSPATEARRDVNEEQRQVLIDSSFAISACEVTIRQFLEFRRDFQYAPEVASRMDCPINRVDLYEAMKFCRWLSEQEPDFNPLESCYPQQSEIRPGMRLADDYLVRRGYRLPTVAEWEYVVRAKSATSRFFGNDDADLDRFCWSARNSGEVTQPVGMLMPNPFGLFDVYGNISEWCHELGRGVDPENNQIRGGDYRSTPRFLRSAMPTTLSADRKLSIVGFRVVKISESH